MIVDAKSPELWTDPKLISGLKSLARQLRWDEGDLLGETASCLLERQRAFIIDSSDPVGYLLSVARRIAERLDPVTLIRKRQKRCETDFKSWRTSIEKGADRRRNGECLFSPGQHPTGREDEPVQVRFVSEIHSRIESDGSLERRSVLRAGKRDHRDKSRRLESASWEFPCQQRGKKLRRNAGDSVSS